MAPKTFFRKASHQGRSERIGYRVEAQDGGTRFLDFISKSFQKFSSLGGRLLKVFELGGGNAQDHCFERGAEGGNSYGEEYGCDKLAAHS